MWKTLAVLLVAMGCLIVSGCNTQKMTCHWTSLPIQVDGHMDDWADIPVSFFAEKGYTIGLANDDERLYLLLRFRDSKWAASIRAKGLTLWFNANGDKDEDITIHYRGGPPMEELSAQSKWMSTFHSDSLAETFTYAVKDMIIEKPISPDGSSGPAVAFALDQGFFNYEFSIPLAEGEVRHYGLVTQTGKTLGVGAKWGGFDRRGVERIDGSGRKGDGSKMTRGGRGGGKGMRGGDRSGMQQEHQPVEIWVRTMLSKPPSD